MTIALKHKLLYPKYHVSVWCQVHNIDRQKKTNEVINQVNFQIH